MSSLWLSLLTSIQAVLMFGPHTVQADFSDICVNSTNSTTCIHTYEQLYNNLAKSKNSFNIESALYPAKRPSSVQVSVNIYGPNKTKNSEPVAKYTWSISCLYAALPATVLQILSLGSILVTNRNETLDIQIPLFCCNISDDDDERRTRVKEMIEGVLAALQDLAVSPGIRDPKLNTAECIIEGHKTDIKANIRAILCMSFFFAFASCPLLADFLNRKQQLGWPKPNTTNDSQTEDTQLSNVAGNDNRTEETERDKLDQIAAKTICIFCFVLAFIGSLILLTALGFSIFFCVKESSPPDIIISIALLIIVDVVVVVVRLKCFTDKVWYSVFLTICATEISYFSCWLLIGIMINPTWGLTVTLLVGFFFATIAYVVYVLLNTTEHKYQVRFSCACIGFAVISLIVVIVMAGQSYNGRETADETLKTALLYVIGGLVSWVSWKLKWSSPDEKTSQAKLERLLERLLEKLPENQNQTQTADPSADLIKNIKRGCDQNEGIA